MANLVLKWVTVLVFNRFIDAAAQVSERLFNYFNLMLLSRVLSTTSCNTSGLE